MRDTKGIIFRLVGWVNARESRLEPMSLSYRENLLSSLARLGRALSIRLSHASVLAAFSFKENKLNKEENPIKRQLKFQVEFMMMMQACGRDEEAEKALEKLFWLIDSLEDGDTK